MMAHTHLKNPVEQAYGGGDALNIRALAEFCSNTQTNFNISFANYQELRALVLDLNTVNKRIIQFMNWLAVTNPQILDEFQATSNAFEKLSPRVDGGEAQAVTSP